MLWLSKRVICKVALAGYRIRPRPKSGRLFYIRSCLAPARIGHRIWSGIFANVPSTVVFTFQLMLSNKFSTLGQLTVLFQRHLKLQCTLWAKKVSWELQVVTSSIMDQFKEMPLLKSLLNFQKNACNICHIPSKCYHSTLENGKQCKDASWMLQITGSNTVMSDKYVHRIINCIEQLTFN